MEQPIIHTMFLHENILFSQHAHFDITESKADPGSNFVLQSSKMEAGATGLPGPHVQWPVARVSSLASASVTHPPHKWEAKTVKEKADRQNHARCPIAQVRNCHIFI